MTQLEEAKAGKITREMAFVAEREKLAPELVPIRLRYFLPVVERLAGWNLIIKARKPQS